MLCLTRKKGESIYIFPDDLPPDMTVAELFAGGQIVFTIQKVRGSQASIGIEAPKALTILRDDAN